MAGVDKTAGGDIPGVGSGIEMLSWWRRAEALDSMDPPIPWFHLLLVLLPWMHRLTIRKVRKTAMQVAVRPEDVASSGRIAGQVHTAAAIPQDRPPYEVMSVTPSSYRHIKSETDIGASETTQRWAWSEHIVTIFHAYVYTSASIKNIRQIIAGIPHLHRVLHYPASCRQER